MDPIVFDSANMRLLPPPSDPTVDPVAAYRADNQTITVWKPSAEELKAIADGGHVLLHVYGKLHPAVLLSVQKMNEVPERVHGLADMSQTRCGVALNELKFPEMWSNHKDRVTCARCKDGT